MDDLLRGVVQQNASDLILKEDQPPIFRVYGDCFPIKGPALDRDEIRELVYTILSPSQIAQFERDMELDLAHEIRGFSRYRVNVFMQRESTGFVARAIPFHMPTMEEINLPQAARDFCHRPRGMILVTGPTGSGKSTTLSAMVSYINERESVHIMAVEDPVEFVYEDREALINQRELGTDTLSFANALKRVLRQDPDVILVGEMRDLETIALAITAAETGHLVFATLHTTNAAQTVDRVIDVFPPYQQQQIRMQLAVNLVGIVSQTLLKRIDGKGRVAAYETLIAVPAVRNIIREAKTFQLPSTIQTGLKQGMMSLDQYLAGLVLDGVVTREAAFDKASDPNNFNQIYQEMEQDKKAAAAAAEAARARQRR
ncbi:MAG: type IV pilus twitching motility protein PilT [Armatimonadetes bacterium]|nr:type IV pilus twitching motility protein PilT [Armatimonadota bacterium]